jgi:hypothetical protein
MGDYSCETPVTTRRRSDPRSGISALTATSGETAKVPEGVSYKPLARGLMDAYCFLFFLFFFFFASGSRRIRFANSSSKAFSPLRTSRVRCCISSDRATPLRRGDGLYITECSTYQKSAVSIGTIWYSARILRLALQ